jgi:protoporphyrinogen oxidase
MHVRGDRVVAAELSTGERIEADLFVSGLPVPTYLKIFPDDDTPGLREIRYTALLSTLCATRQPIKAPFYWMNLSSLDKTACAIFNLSSLNPTIGGPGETCFNFVTHLSDASGVFDLSDAELTSRYHADFRDVMGVDLDPLWTVVNRIRAYSPIFTPGYRNVPVRSRRWGNMFFTGNYRTFPSITSTGTALGAGLETAAAITDAGAALRDSARRMRLRSMPRPAAGD